jgi:hypothetical protein
MKRIPSVVNLLVIVVMLLGASIFHASAANTFRNCKKVSGLSFGPDKATASYRADREMKKNLQPWTAKGYRPGLADELPDAYKLDCWEKQILDIKTHVCKYSVLMCKYRSSGN